MKISHKGLIYESVSNTNSLGRVISKTPEGIANFWKWFGDSITVDNRGNPIVLFHGTPEDFEEPNSLFFWAAIDSKVSEHYTYKKLYDDSDRSIPATNSNIMPVYFKITNPFEGDALPKMCEVVEFVTEAYKQSGEFDESFRFYLDELRKYAEESNLHEETTHNYGYWHESDLYFGDEGALRIKEMLIHLGFDGIHFTEDGVSTYAIFNPNQVKSALGNSGEYNSSNNAITKE